MLLLLKCTENIYELSKIHTELNKVHMQLNIAPGEG